MNRDRKIIYLLIAVIILTATAWGYYLYWKNSEEIPQYGGTYKEGVLGEPRFINPLLSPANEVDMDLVRIIYSGLFKYDGKGEIIPDLAQEYQISPDGKVYTITLKDNISWHDGEKFTADDVIFTIQAAQNPDYQSFFAATLFQGLELNKIDDYKVEFKLNQPYAPFLANLTFGIMPKHIWEFIEPKNINLAEFNLKPIGTGPYKFKSLKKDKNNLIRQLDLVRNDNYHLGKPYLDHLVIKFFRDESKLIAELKRKEIDGTASITAPQKDKFSKIKDLKLLRIALPQYFAVFINKNKNPELANVGLRTALAQSTNKEEIIKQALNGEGFIVDAPVLPGMIGYYPEVKKIPFNPEGAKQNLEEAGWKDTDNDGVREKDGKKLELTIISSDFPEYQKTAEILQRQWKDMGAIVHLQTESAGILKQEIIRPRNYEVFLYGEVLGHDPDLYHLWHSTQTRDPGLNLSLYKNDEVDKWLEEGRTTQDVSKREELYRKFQDKIADEIPAIFLYSPYYLYALGDKIKGVEIERLVFPSERFGSVEKWYVKTKRVWKKK